MGMPQTEELWTAERLQSVPDDGWRHEVIDGVHYMTPAPTFRHQRALAELFTLLQPYCKRVGLDLLFAPAAVRFGKLTEVQPDLLVLPLRNDGRRAEQFSDVGRLVLAVEVLSPGTAQVDRTVKRALYQREGVPEYWIVDVNGRCVERWRGECGTVEKCGGTIEWKGGANCEVLVIDLTAYFAVVCGE